MIERDLDLVCLGRAAVDLYGEQIGAELEDVSTFAKYVGGCPANIAIGTSRLGLRSGVVSGVGDEAMGHFVRATLKDEGVDVTNLVTKAEHLTGLAILGMSPPDRFPLLFYRTDCADMALVERDIHRKTLLRTRALLVTGTHCSTETTFAATKRAVAMAVEADAEVILDIDYRPVLWGAVGHGGGEDRATAHLGVRDRLLELLPHCRLVVGTEEEMCVAAGVETIDDALMALREATPAVLVRKRGEAGCVCYPGDIESPIVGDPFPVTVLNVLGAGDAFMSGFLSGYLRGMALEHCCRLGNANGALVVTRHGCAPAMPYWEELQAFMGQGSKISALDSLHRRMGRRAVEGRRHLLDFTGSSGEQQHSAADHAQCLDISRKVLERLGGSASGEQFGIVVKEQHGLRASSEWIGETSRLVFQDVGDSDNTCCRFLGGREALAVVASWPSAVGAKVSAKVDTDCGIERIVAHLEHLQAACDATGRPLLVQLTADVTPDRMRRIATAIQWCYKAGVHPDWWALPVDIEPMAWERVGTLIGEYDPYCHGVLLTGDVIDEVALSTVLEELYATQKIVRGCVVGGNYWCEALVRGLEHYASPEELVASVADRMGVIFSAGKTLVHPE